MTSKNTYPKIITDLYSTFYHNRVTATQIDSITIRVDHFHKFKLIGSCYISLVHISSVISYKYPMPLYKFAFSNRFRRLTNA